MKKLALWALTAATVFTTALSPFSVQASSGNYVCGKTQKNGCVIVKKVVVTNQKELQELLSKLEKEKCNGNLKGCAQNGSTSECGKQEQCGKNEAPENNGQETNKPDSGTTGTEQESDFAKQVVKLVNEERVKAGLKELTIDTNIEAAALVRAKEIKQSFSHTRPDGRSFSTALKEQGVSYKGAGENIAWGQKTPEEVMKGWMNSEGHRANILNPNFTKIGVGHYQTTNGTNYWVQLFAY